MLNSSKCLNNFCRLVRFDTERARVGGGGLETTERRSRDLTGLLNIHPSLREKLGGMLLDFILEPLHQPWTFA